MSFSICCECVKAQRDVDRERNGQCDGRQESPVGGTFRGELLRCHRNTLDGRSNICARRHMQAGVENKSVAAHFAPAPLTLPTSLKAASILQDVDAGVRIRAGMQPKSIKSPYAHQSAGRGATRRHVSRRHTRMCGLSIPCAPSYVIAPRPSVRCTFAALFFESMSRNSGTPASSVAVMTLTKSPSSRRTPKSTSASPFTTYPSNGSNWELSNGTVMVGTWMPVGVVVHVVDVPDRNVRRSFSFLLRRRSPISFNLDSDS